MNEGAIWSVNKKEGSCIICLTNELFNLLLYAGFGIE